MKGRVSSILSHANRAGKRPTGALTSAGGSAATNPGETYCRRNRLNQQLLHHACFIHVGQRFGAVAVLKDELAMVETDEVQNGGLQVAHTYAIDGGGISKFVGSSINHAAANAAARHPNGKGVAIVVAAVT